MSHKSSQLSMKYNAVPFKWNSVSDIDINNKKKDSPTTQYNPFESELILFLICPKLLSFSTVALQYKFRMLISNFTWTTNVIIRKIRDISRKLLLLTVFIDSSQIKLMWLYLLLFLCVICSAAPMRYDWQTNMQNTLSMIISLAPVNSSLAHMFTPAIDVITICVMHRSHCAVHCHRSMQCSHA